MGGYECLEARQTQVSTQVIFFIKLNVTAKIKAADTYNLLIFQDHVKKGITLCFQPNTKMLVPNDSLSESTANWTVGVAAELVS